MADPIRHLMQVAHRWADEPDGPDGRSDTLEIELRKAFARHVEVPTPARGGLLATLTVIESDRVPPDEIHVRDSYGRIVARVVGIAAAGVATDGGRDA